VGLGVPAHAEGRDYSYEFLRDCPQPKLFVSGTLDQYGPVAEVEAAVGMAREPKELVWISEADHFFAGKLEDVRQAIRSWALRFFPALVQP
jgi:hypothetical protein